VELALVVRDRGTVHKTVPQPMAAHRRKLLTAASVKWYRPVVNLKLPGLPGSFFTKKTDSNFNAINRQNTTKKIKKLH